MSRRAMRSAIKTWAEVAQTQGEIDGLASVFTAPNIEITEEDFESDRPYGSWGGIVMLIIMPGPTDEVRVSVGEPGMKRLDHPVELRFMMRWTDPDDRGEGATDALDAFIDTVKDLIRADRNAGSTPDVVWQWGEADLTDRIGEPAYDGTCIQIMGAVTTTASEFINA